jgi:hypothetical protein
VWLYAVGLCELGSATVAYEDFKMIVFYLVLSLFIGFAAGFLTCWQLAKPEIDELITLKSGISELATLFEPLGYKLVDGEWTKPDDPAWTAMS